MPKNSASTSSSRNDGKISAAAGGNPTSSPAVAIFGYIAGGILVWSLIGWGLDNLLKTQWMVLGGALLGLIGGTYLSFAPRFRQRHSKDDVSATRSSASESTGSAVNRHDSGLGSNKFSVGKPKQAAQYLPNEGHSREETR